MENMERSITQLKESIILCNDGDRIARIELYQFSGEYLQRLNNVTIESTRMIIYVDSIVGYINTEIIPCSVDKIKEKLFSSIGNLDKKTIFISNAALSTSFILNPFYIAITSACNRGSHGEGKGLLYIPLSVLNNKMDNTPFHIKHDIFINKAIYFDNCIYE